MPLLFCCMHLQALDYHRSDTLEVMRFALQPVSRLEDNMLSTFKPGQWLKAIKGAGNGDMPLLEGRNPRILNCDDDGGSNLDMDPLGCGLFEDVMSNRGLAFGFNVRSVEEWIGEEYRGLALGEGTIFGRKRKP